MSMLPERLQAQKQKLSVQRSNKAVAYIRVSDDGQVDGESLTTQKERIQQYANQNGLEIVKWFGDDKRGQSAKTINKREQMKAMIKYSAQHKGKIGYALFYNMKRASRNATSYYSDFRTVLEGLGMAVRSASEHIDDTPAGRFIEGVLVLNGQLDNEIKAGTTIDNMEGVARQGWYQHQHLIGYDLVHIKIGPKKKRTTLKRNKEAEAVKELFEAFAKGGLTQADIKRMAKEKGLRNAKGKHPDDNGIHRMLTQPAYAGYICSKHTKYDMVEGKHFKEAIVTEEVFMAVQQRINTSSRKRPGRTFNMPVDKVYPLSRFIICFNCNNNFYYSSPKTGSGGRSPRYHCARKQCRGIVPSVGAEKANEAFAAFLKDISPSESTLRLYKEILNRTAMNQLDNINSRIGRLRNAVSALDTERSTAMRRWNKGEMTDTDKDEIIATLESEKADLREQLVSLEDQQSIKVSQIDYAMNFMGDAHKLWVDADLEMRQRFQKVIFPEGVVLNSKTLEFGTEKMSPLYRYAPIKKDLSVKEKSLLVIREGIEPPTPALGRRCSIH